MRYAIIGSRTFVDYKKFCDTLEPHLKYISQIVSGGAKGADSLAAKYAILNSIPLKEFIPEYDKYGSGAPFVRNKLIVRNSDIVIAFWDMKSNGTRHSIEFANSLKIKTIIIEIENSFDTPNIEENLWLM